MMRKIFVTCTNAQAFETYKNELAKKDRKLTKKILAEPNYILKPSLIYQLL